VGQHRDGAVEQAANSLRHLRIAEIAELHMQLNARERCIESQSCQGKLSFKYEAPRDSGLLAFTGGRARLRSRIRLNVN
jgi:hypothetical protein